MLVCSLSNHFYSFEVHGCAAVCGTRCYRWKGVVKNILHRERVYVADGVSPVIAEKQISKRVMMRNSCCTSLYSFTGSNKLQVLQIIMCFGACLHKLKATSMFIYQARSFSAVSSQTNIEIPVLRPGTLLGRARGSYTSAAPWHPLANPQTMSAALATTPYRAL